MITINRRQALAGAAVASLTVPSMARVGIVMFAAKPFRSETS